VLAPLHAGVRARIERLGVDAHALHRREVDDERTLAARAVPGDAVRAAANGDRHALLARVTDGRDDVGGPRAARDERGPPVDHGVEDRAGLLVALVVFREQLPAEALRELRERVVTGGTHVCLLS